MNRDKTREALILELMEVKLERDSLKATNFRNIQRNGNLEGKQCYDDQASFHSDIVKSFQGTDKIGSFVFLRGKCE